MAMDVGFLGLGGMGKAMAANLLKIGHRVRVWNRSPDAVDLLVRAGAERAATPAEAFRGDAVLSMLADDEAVRDVIVRSGALDAAPAGTLHVNMATVSAALAEEMAAAHAARGLRYLSAPVFGRTEVAQAAQLNIVVSGDARDIDRVQPLFDALGQKTWRMGEAPAAAAIVKIVGNLMIACAIEAMAEGIAVARRYDVPPAALLEMLTSTLFASPIYKNYGAIIAEERFEPAAFRLVLGLKDVRLALAAGESASVPLPFASVLRDNLVEAIAHGDGDRDWTALAKVAWRRAGLIDGEPRPDR